MVPQPENQKVYRFPGIRVTVPDQPVPVRVIDKPLPPLSSCRAARVLPRFD